MTGYIIRRIIYSALLLVISTTAIFFILNLTPGSPYARARAEVEERAKIAGKAPPPDSHWARLDALLGLDKNLS